MGRNDGTDLKKMTSSRNKYKILILGSKNQLWVYKMAKTTFHGKKKRLSDFSSLQGYHQAK